MIAGIDFGSKLSGNTVVALLENNKVYFNRSEKGKDSDVFLLEVLHSDSIQIVGIDAPLSLPLKYFGKGDDYFFREADRELGAMSPLFLGGLTARAIRIRDILVESQKQVIEVYPSVKLIEQGFSSSDEVEKVMEMILHSMSWKVEKLVKIDAHTRDSLLALLSVEAFRCQKAKCFGLVEEGLIYI